VQSDGPVKRQPPRSHDPGIPVVHGPEDVKVTRSRVIESPSEDEVHEYFSSMSNWARWGR